MPPSGFLFSLRPSFYFSPSILKCQLSFDLLWQSEGFQDSRLWLCQVIWRDKNIYNKMLAENRGPINTPCLLLPPDPPQRSVICLLLCRYRTQKMWQYILRDHLNIDTAYLFSSWMAMKTFSEELFDLAVNLGHKEYSQSRLCCFYYYCCAECDTRDGEHMSLTFWTCVDASPWLSAELIGAMKIDSSFSVRSVNWIRAFWPDVVCVAVELWDKSLSHQLCYCISSSKKPIILDLCENTGHAGRLLTERLPSGQCYRQGQDFHQKWHQAVVLGASEGPGWRKMERRLVASACPGWVWVITAGRSRLA